MPVLSYYQELVFAFFDEGSVVYGDVFVDFGAINSDCALGDEFTGFFLGVGEIITYQGVDKRDALIVGWEVIGEFEYFVSREAGKVGTSIKQHGGEILDGVGGGAAMDNFSGATGERALSEALFGMLGVAS